MLCRLFKKSYLADKIKFILVFILLYIVCRFFNITCLFYKITSIPCPACNMARALLALARGNIKAYLDYNAMALPVATVFLGELFRDLFGKYKSIFCIYSVIILTINLVYYAKRLC